MTKRILLLLTVLLSGIATMWADTETTYSPVLDVNFRTASGNTAWNSGFPKNAADEGNTDFELTYAAGLFALQKYTVPDLQYATKLVLTLTVGSKSGVDAVRVWSLANTTWTASSGVDDIVGAVTSVVGVAPRATEGTANTPLVTGSKVADSNPAKATFTITGTALATIKANAAADGTFTLLLTNNDLTNSNNKRSYLSNNIANAEANRPTLVATTTAPAPKTAKIVGTGVEYETLLEAFNAAVSAGVDAEIEVSDDQTLTGRLTWNKSGKTLTITPTKDITIKGTTNNMWFLANENAAVLNIGSENYTITLDGENKAYSIGSNNPIVKYEKTAQVALTNVVFKNFNLNNTNSLVGGATSDGLLTLKNITFNNCIAPYNGLINKLRVTNDRLALKGYLNQENCSGTTIYCASETKSSGTNGRIKIDDANFTANKAITINFAGATYNEGVVVAIGTSAANAALFLLTDDSWTLERKSNGDLVMAKPIIPTCKIGSTNYIDLAAALAAVQDGETITLLADQEIAARVNIKNLAITIDGGGFAIKRASGYTNGLLFLTQTADEGYSSNITIQNAVIDGQNVSATAAMFEASNYGLTTLKSVTIQNAKNTGNAIIVNKSNGSLELDGVTFTTCEGAKGLVFVGTNNVTLKGENNIPSIYVEKQLLLTATGATFNSPVTLIVDGSRTAGTIVAGGKVTDYVLSGTDSYVLEQSGDDVVVADPVIPTAQIGNTGYADLAAALAAAQDGDNIVLLGDQEITSRVNIKNMSLTISGAYAIRRASSYTNGLLFLTQKADDGMKSALTLDGVTLDGQNLSTSAAMIEASNSGTTTLKDVTIHNCVTTAGAAVVNKSSGKLILKGAIDIPSIFIGKNLVLTATGAAISSPITLVTDNGQGYGMIVKGGNVADYTTESFRLSQQGDNVYAMMLPVAANFEHPALLHTAADITRIKGLLTQDPWKSAYIELETASAGTSAGAVEWLKRMDKNNWSNTYPDYANFSRLVTDAKLAYYLALRYQLKGSIAAATAAVNILNDWAQNCKGFLRVDGYTNEIPDPNEYLMLIQAYQLANAAELVTGYNGWAADDQNTFKNWMRQTFADVAYLFLSTREDKHYWLNWDLAALNALVSVGVLCDDQALVDYALDYINNGAGTGNKANAIVATHDDPDSDETLAQCQESGRDQGHATLDVTLMGVLCQTAENANLGTDLFTEYQALEMAEYIGKYNIKNDNDEFAYDNVPFTDYSNGEVTHTAISSEARGTIRPSWELFLAYAKKNDKAARYTQMWAEQARKNNAGGETTSAQNDELGFGTLMFYDAGTVADYSYTLTVTDAEAATLILPFDATIPSGVKCYTLSYNGGDRVITTEVTTTLPANTAVLVNAEASDYTFEGTSVWTKATTMTTGALTGVYVDTYCPTSSYILGKKNGKVGFYKTNANSNYIRANHAYLTAEGAGAREFLGIDIDSETTGISDATHLNDNGQLINDNYFDLQGRRVAQPVKGLYIVNGKKVVK